ncbi:unnamed protein product [Closterium sp. Naga37s-1]|nr:unnamed protein product [Closterium sp. Naga37s-1]
MQRHQRTTKHRDAIRNQELAFAKATGQHRIPDCPKARDVEHEAVESLLDTLLFITKTDAPIEMWVQLVDLTAVHSQMRRLEVFIRERYIDCGQQFGAKASAQLSPFLSRHSAACSRRLKVQGVDTDGEPREHEFTLHEEQIPGYSVGAGDLPSCIRTCRSFATELLYNLDFRLGDLSNLNAAKLFMPRTWPRGKEARDAECKEYMEKLAVMFHARDREEILPGEFSCVLAH